MEARRRQGVLAPAEHERRAGDARQVAAAVGARDDRWRTNASRPTACAMPKTAAASRSSSSLVGWTMFGSNLRGTSPKRPCWASRIRDRRAAVCSGVSTCAEVPRRARRATRSGATRITSRATWPLIEGPARENRPGVASSTARHRRHRSAPRNVHDHRLDYFPEASGLMPPGPLVAQQPGHERQRRPRCAPPSRTDYPATPAPQCAQRHPARPVARLPSRGHRTPANLRPETASTPRFTPQRSRAIERDVPAGAGTKARRVLGPISHVQGAFCRISSCRDCEREERQTGGSK